MLNKKTFLNKNFTFKGQPRAYVKLKNLDTLWFNTGTLCNLQCKGCYIESSPKNDSILYIKFDSVKEYINEIIKNKMKTRTIGFTGGEPFMNPEIIEMLDYVLRENFEVLVLSNGLRPLELKFSKLINLPNLDNLTIRLSIDHYKKFLHEDIRGKNTWDKLIKNIKWLKKNNLNITLASRLNSNEKDEIKRTKFQKLFSDLSISVNAYNKEELVLFPEMDKKAPATEITQECWSILKKDPNSIMCSNSRMIVQKKGHISTKVLACTLITKNKDFELGSTLKDADKEVFLNHPFCSQFCVLGNSSCS